MGVMCYWCFIKICCGCPSEQKRQAVSLRGKHTHIRKMGKKPRIICTDDKTAIASGEFEQYVEDEGIELWRTRGHPAFAEWFNTTFKDKPFKRIENDENNRKRNIRWIDYIEEIMLTCNDKDAHSATGQRPNEARK